MATITIPGVGPVERKWVIGAGVGVAGYVLWRYWKAAGTSQTVEPGAIDPMTGLPYPTGGESGGYQNPNPVTSVVDTTTGGTIRTNTEWTAAVVEALGNIGIDAGWTGAVMGKYLSRQPLKVDEAATVRTAWAFKGKPPEGPDTFTLDTGQSTPGGGGGGGTQPLYQTVAAGWFVDQWIRDVQAQYNPEFSWDKLYSWNPQVNSNVDWANGQNKTGSSASNRFKAAATYRVK